MMRIICLIINLLQLIIKSDSVIIECSYGSGAWPSDSTYYCFVKNNLNITSQVLAVINSTSGSHYREDKSNNDVTFIGVRDKVVHYFPRDMDKFFGNLKMISFHNCGLKEINQSDLKPFPKLAYLYLSVNDIKILKKGLFEFNPELQAIWISSNKIFHIEENIFDHLGQLGTLWLSGNPCIDMEAKNDFTEVKEVVTEAERKCRNEDYLEVHRKLKELEENFKDFNEKLEMIEGSQYAEYFNDRIVELSKFKNQSLSTEKREDNSFEQSALDSITKNLNGTGINLKNASANIDSQRCSTNNDNSQLGWTETSENVDQETERTSENPSNHTTTSTYDSYGTVNERISNLEASVGSIIQSMELSINLLTTRIENLEKIFKNFMTRNTEMMDDIKGELNVAQNNIEYMKVNSQN